MNKILKKAPQVAEILKLMAHEGRLKILCFLSEKELTVSDLEELTDLSQSQISQYLKKFEALKIVTARKEGKWSYYQISSPEIHKLLKSMYEIFCR